MQQNLLSNAKKNPQKILQIDFIFSKRSKDNTWEKCVVTKVPVTVCCTLIYPTGLNTVETSISATVHMPFTASRCVRCLRHF